MRGFVAADELSTTAALSTDALEVLSTACSCLSCLVVLSLATSSSAHSSDILFFDRKETFELLVVALLHHVKPMILLYNSSFTVSYVSRR